MRLYFIDILLYIFICQNNSKIMEKQFAKIFPIKVIFYSKKGLTASKDTYQMWTPGLNEHLLQIDNRGEFYLDDVHYVNLQGINYPVIQSVKEQGLVFVTLTQNKNNGVLEVGVNSTLDEILRLRVSLRK